MRGVSAPGRLLPLEADPRLTGGTIRHTLRALTRDPAARPHRPASNASRYDGRICIACARSSRHQPTRSRAARRSPPARGAIGATSCGCINGDILLWLSLAIVVFPAACLFGYRQEVAIPTYL